MVGGNEEQLKIEAFVPGDPFTKMVQSFRRMDKSVEKMRVTASNEDWKEYVEVCFTPVILKETFKRNKKNVRLGEYLTVYDEAFALVVMENNLEAWIAEGLNWGVKTKEMEDLKKYYNKGSTKSRSVGGMKRKWSVKGKKRFNEIVEVLEKQRNETESKEKEEWLKEIWCGGDGEGTDAIFLNGDGNDNDNDDSENEEEFVPRNGFMVSV